MKAALVIMAAGLGSRYGGSKQVDGIGPSGEILMEYSIYDALRAGFTKVVFIIKPEMEDMVRDLCGDRIARQLTAEGTPIEVCYATQDFSTVPSFYKIPAGRTKPFGTVHAVLCAAPYVQEPFCVINADDYYGVDAYRTIYDELMRLPAEGRATMVGYLLQNTASLNGTVSRGICAVENGCLLRCREALKVQLYADGSLRDLNEGTDFAADTIASMNFWGFAPSIFPALQTYFETFLREEAGDNPKAECLLPVMVGKQLETGALTVSVLQSAAKWFGMTYREDRETVAAALGELHRAGIYPKSLREL
ncbi:MAG: nucleotidyltransferase, partial [Oscillospiraceae bacterium]